MCDLYVVCSGVGFFVFFVLVGCSGFGRGSINEGVFISVVVLNIITEKGFRVFRIGWLWEFLWYRDVCLEEE